MKKNSFCAIFTAVVLTPIATPLSAQENQGDLEISADELPRISATEPEDVMGGFELESGFELALVAHEPDVVDPIAMTFDEHGSAWVIEMRGYSERRDEALGRIRVLTDTTGDGNFDRSVVFKDGLRWPTAILCYKGGVFVGATPDVFYFRDTTGDGVCDEERTVFTGFGAGRPELNMQALFNSFRWGPDCRIWGATAGNGGVVTKPGDPDFEAIELRGSDFSFDPEKLDLRAENGTAQYGMSFDSDGRRFVCSNSRHILWVAYERHQVEPNPFFSLPAALVSIPEDGDAAPVYRISPDEPWRIVRTRLRVSGVVRGTVEGGGRVSGYFTSATGVHLYWGGTFGPEYHNNAFVGDVGSNLVHRKIVRKRDDSSGLVAVRPEPEEETEFLRSRDIWFRPTNFATGPDGCLYITDMYREVIEHPWSLPEPIKKHLDLNSGWDRGRIYRVAPVGFQPGPVASLSDFSDAELNEILAADSPSDWQATTARRLLYERGKPVIQSQPNPLALGATLADIREAPNDPWLRAAYLNSLRTVADIREAWEGLEGEESGLAAELARMAGRSRDAGLIGEVANRIADGAVGSTTADSLEGLMQYLPQGSDLVEIVQEPERWERLAGEAAGLLSRSDASTEGRSSAVRLLSLIGGEERAAQLQAAFVATEKGDALVPVLARSIADLSVLIDHYAKLPDSVRAELANRISASKVPSLYLLDKLRDEEIDLNELPASLIDGLRQHEDGDVQTLAAEVLPEMVSREEVILAYREALNLRGDPEKGALAFAKACQACHLSYAGEGIELGPTMASFASMGKDSLLENILDPNREVAPQYQTFVFELHDGSMISGMIQTEDQEEVTVRMPGGIERTFPRREVSSMTGLGVSLMPEGLEATLTVQEMADLLAYIMGPGED